MELSHLAFAIQVLCIPLVTVLLWQLTRAVTGRFLIYWTFGWVVLSVALLSMQVAVVAVKNEHSNTARFAYSLYCCLSYVFGYLICAGCRALTKDAPLYRCAWI